MKRIILSLIGFVVVLGLTNPIFATGTSDPICTLQGLGRLPDGDLFSGQLTQSSANNIVGVWKHRIPTGQIVLIHPDQLVCRPNGSQLVDILGPATVDGQQGFSAFVAIQDRPIGDPETQLLTASRRFYPSQVEDGTLDFDGQAAVTIPTSLQVVEGYAKFGIAKLIMVRSASEDRVVCRYRPIGNTFRLIKCIGEAPGTLPVKGDEIVMARGMTLHVGHVFPKHAIKVEVGIQVAPPLLPDTYQIVVLDSNNTEVYSADADLVSGDLFSEF